MQQAGLRRSLGALFGAGAGIAIGLADSSPGFDATGLTVVGLVTAAFLSVVVAGTRSVGVALLLGLLVGISVPILELRGSAGAPSMAALAFALVGALCGAAAVRMRSGGITVH